MAQDAVRDAMHQFDNLLNDHIQKIENISYQHKHDIRKLPRDEYQQMVKGLYDDIGTAINNYPEPAQRKSNRDKMLPLIAIIYDWEFQKQAVDFKSPEQSFEMYRAVLQNLKTAKYDLDYPPARRHCMCWSAPNCLHTTWCKCGRAPPVFQLHGQEPDRCAACKTADHQRCEDEGYEVNYPDNDLRRGIEVEIGAVKAQKKNAIVFPKTYGMFQRRFIHQAAEVVGLPSCSLGMNGDRRCYVFLNPTAKEEEIAKFQDGDYSNLRAVEVMPSTTSSEGVEGYGPRGRGFDRSDRTPDDRSRSARGRGGKSDSKGSGYYDRGSGYEEKGEYGYGGYGDKGYGDKARGGYGDKAYGDKGYGDKGYGDKGDKSWGGKYSKW
jgi:hypothetical protein